MITLMQGECQMSEMSVVFEHVTKRYLQNAAVRDVSFALPRGKMIGMIGPNGSGKSTMLKLMSGLLRPSSGRVLVEGRAVDRRISDVVSYASDKDVLYGFYNVSEMIHFYEEVFPDFQIARAREMMSFLNLNPSVRVKALSKGNGARLKMLLALSRNAPLILMDEPLSGIDPMARTAIIKSLISFIDLEKQTVILSTHEVAEVEPLLDTVMLVHNGQVCGIQEVVDIQTEHHQNLAEWMEQTINAVARL
jgi:ABC-2 type transport system ATP-binding protein